MRKKKEKLRKIIEEQKKIFNKLDKRWLTIREKNEQREFQNKINSKDAWKTTITKARKQEKLRLQNEE